MAAHTLSRNVDRVAIFPSELGWMAMVGSGHVLRGLAFGHQSPERALDALGLSTCPNVEAGDWNGPLLRRLQAYASGQRVNFRGIKIDLSDLTAFRRRQRGERLFAIFLRRR